jgi:hypothetical protein
MLSSIKHRVILLLQLLIVMVYIIFEELIWEGIAKPIYEAVHSLRILQKIEVKLQSVSPSVILAIFVIMLIVVEAAGIYAGMLFVSGQIVIGLILYISKIPIAAFTFWLFRVTEEKLMQFGWFKWIYDQIMKVISWLKSCEMYQKTKERLVQVKEGFNTILKQLKEKYFSKKSPFVEKIKQLYMALKKTLRK